jgi:hypothetical protein
VKDIVTNWILAGVGILLVVMGAVWTLQGLGYVGGSFMSGATVWAVIGPIVAVAGIVLTGSPYAVADCCGVKAVGHAGEAFRLPHRRRCDSWSCERALDATRKWPRWVVPIWSSNASSVTHTAAHHPGVVDEQIDTGWSTASNLAASRTEASAARSRWKGTTFASGVPARDHGRRPARLARSRQASTTVARARRALWPPRIRCWRP